jgi:hypothetical protein
MFCDLDQRPADVHGSYLQAPPGQFMSGRTSAPCRLPKSRLSHEESDPSLPTATTADRIVLEIRKFIAAAIFFNTQAAEKVGIGLTDLQMLHMLQLYGPSTPRRLALWTGLSIERRRHRRARSPPESGLHSP